jgi:hypothetical protein
MPPAASSNQTLADVFDQEVHFSETVENACLELLFLAGMFRRDQGLI